MNYKSTKQHLKGKVIPTIVNGTLDSFCEFASSSYNTEETSNVKDFQSKMWNIQADKRLNATKHKVVIIGDSHVRNCSIFLQDNLNTDYKVSSFVKPGALMNEITKTAKEKLKLLKKDDLVIVWGGANDISRNNSKQALKSLSKFVNENNELNIVLINSPHRHDLAPDSCVNQEVIKFNRQLNKIMKLQSKVKVLELSLDRNRFTKHGLHLNSNGKKLVLQKLALIIQQFFMKNQSVPLPIPWINSCLVDNNTETTGRNLTAQLSQHRRNCPAQRNPDFLWT